ncbi:MAG: hypothetical protein J7M13_09495 [Synergistetes bacterium]|nr:hypothetical protein [Synergistota bacterium]
MLNVISAFVPLIYPRLVSRLKFSLKEKAPLAVIAGTLIFLIFFMVPPVYRFFTLGVFLLPSAIGLAGFYSCVGEKFMKAFKMKGFSEFFFVILGMLPFLVFFLVLGRFYLRILFNFLMIYGLGTLISIMI